MAKRFGARRPRRPQPGRLPEKAVQIQVRGLYEQLGARVYVSGTVRPRVAPCYRCGAPPAHKDFSTRQTAGIPDLEVWLPPKGGKPARLLKHEVKAEGGRLSPDQARYREYCLEAGIAHVVGGLDAAIAWLHQEGYITAAQVPHYRLSEEAQRG
jgi:hypothetical protein